MKINLVKLDMSALALLLFASFWVSNQTVHIALSLAALLLLVLLVEGSLLHVLQLWVYRRQRRAGRARVM